MVFSAPIWLLGLLPWGLLALVLLMSRRPRTEVPFLELWRLNAPQESIRRSFSTPPIGVILALLALLIAIVAAAGPTVRKRGGQAVTVIVDTGASMSAGQGGSRRYVSATAELVWTLRQDVDDEQQIDLVVVPSSMKQRGPTVARRITLGQLTSEVDAHAPSAVDTQEHIQRTVSERLTDASARVILVSDRVVEASDPRLVQVAPAVALNDIGIAAVTVRRTPRAQAMVRLHRLGNFTTGVPITLRLTSGGRSVERLIDAATILPQQNLFIPIPQLGQVLTAELLGMRDDFSGNDRVDLVAEQDWPVIEPIETVGELQRLIDIYAASRPPGERSVHIRLASNANRLGTSPGLIVSTLASPATTPTRASRSVDHPLLEGIDVASVTMPAAVDRRLPAGEWQPILFDAAGPLLAVRENIDALSRTAVRQGWCAVDPRGWSQQVEYVLFWSAVFDWLGGVGSSGTTPADQLIAWPLEDLSPQWQPVDRVPGGDRATYWPGIYERQGDSKRRAFAAAPLPANESISTRADTKEKLAALVHQGDRPVPLAPTALVLAMVLLGASAAIWRRQPNVERSSLSAART